MPLAEVRVGQPDLVVRALDAPADPTTDADIAAGSDYYFGVCRLREQHPAGVTDAAVAQALGHQWRMAGAAAGFDSSAVAARLTAVEALQASRHQPPAAAPARPAAAPALAAAPAGPAAAAVPADLTATISAAVTQAVQPLQQDVRRIKEQLDRMERDATNTRRDLTKVQRDFASMQREFASVQRDVASMQRGVASMQRDVTKVQRDVASMQQDVTKVLHRTSLEHRLAVQHNGKSAMPDHSLQPVPHPDSGELPGWFPGTNDELKGISKPRLTRLLRFYDLRTEGTTLEMHNRLVALIGKLYAGCQVAYGRPRLSFNND
ncbi:hypothetical protein ABPG77_009921 [Micractinium sp. CCAP 211/92]